MATPKPPKVLLTIRFEPALLARLRQISQAEDRSLNSQILHLKLYSNLSESKVRE